MPFSSSAETPSNLSLQDELAIIYGMLALSSNDIPKFEDCKFGLNFAGVIYCNIQLEKKEGSDLFSIKLQFYTDHEPSQEELAYLIHQFLNDNKLSIKQSQHRLSVMVGNSEKSKVEAYLAGFRRESSKAPEVSDIEALVMGYVTDAIQIEPLQQIENYAEHYRLEQLAIEVDIRGLRFTAVIRKGVLFFMVPSRTKGELATIVTAHRDSVKFEYLSQTLAELPRFIIKNLDLVKDDGKNRVLKYSDQDDFTERISTGLRAGPGTDMPTAEVPTV